MRAEIPVFIVLGTVLATLLLFYVSSRYRLPALPALVALAGSSLAWCLESAQRSRRAAVFAACVFTLSLAYVPLARRDLLAVLDARGLADLAEAQLASGFQENAVTLYRRAVSMNPEDAYARLDLSKALRATGDAPGAERELREAVRIAPALSEARYDLGVLLFESGRLGPAAEEFRQAFRLDPSSVPAANNFLGTLLKLGRKDEAIHVHGEMTARGTPVDPPLAAWIHDLTSGNARPPASKSE